MFRHYLAFAFARLAKAPFTSAALVLTLSLGLACFVAAWGASAYLRSGDSYHPDTERLYAVCQGCSGSITSILAPGPIAEALRDDVPELEGVARLGLGVIGETAVSAGEAKTFLAAVAADPELFELFSFRFLEGDPKTALRTPDQVVLTQDTARRLFGEAPALGRTVRVDGRRDAAVAGVIAPPRRPTFMDMGFFRFDMLTGVSPDDPYAKSWFSFYAFTFVRLPPSMPPEAFQARLDELTASRVGAGLDGRPYRLTTLPVGHLMTLGVPAFTSSVLLVFGALILLVAGLNYANLVAARAESRLKETGLRKVLGAGRAQLFAQHAVEALLLVLPALGLAALVVAATAPVARDVVNIDPTWFLAQGPGGALFLAALAVGTAAAVALYPALASARARAVDALGSGTARAGSGITARVLVGVQFFSVSFLLIVVAVIRAQLAHVEDVALDPADDPVVVLSDFPRSGVPFDALAAALGGAPHVRSATAVNVPPLSAVSSTWVVAATDEPGVSGTQVMRRYVGPGYAETLGVEMAAGRTFDPAGDRSGVETFRGPGAEAPLVIDRRMASALGLGEPEAALGKTIYHVPQSPEEPRRTLGVVIGVTETDHASSPLLGELARSGVLTAFDPAHIQAQTPVIRIDPADVPGALAEIEGAWAALAPDVPFRARFLDDLLAESLAPIRTAGAVVVGLSLCALAISTTGLLGIAVYVAARRRREMGIRKTLGASALRLGRMLIIDFSKPVLAANLLAWPVGYLVAQRVLQLFTDRIALTPATFLVSTALTLAIAWAAVMGEVWKAASVRPAEALRHA